MSRALAVAALFVVVGCGGDSSGPAVAAVSGRWTLAASNVAGSGITCGLSNTPLQLTQSGTAFTGSYGPGVLSCSGPGGTITNPAQGIVVSGQVNGAAVSFDLDTQDFRLSGTISGASMTGTAVVRLVSGSQTVTLTGPWSAVRQ